MNYQPINSCDGKYKSIDVHFTSNCPHSCKWCVADKIKPHNDGKPNPDAILKSIISNDEGDKEDVLIMGGEPFLYPEELLELVKGIKRCTALKVYITTSMPAIIDVYDSNTLHDILAWADGLNISIQHYDEAIADKMRGTKSEFDRQGLYENMPFKNKIRININLVKGYLDTWKDIVECVKHYDRMRFNAIKISELQHKPEWYVNFEEIFKVELDAPFSRGCQTVLTAPELKDITTPIILKRSCYLVESSLKPSEDCIKKYNEYKADNKFMVIYEDGTVANRWICEEETPVDEASKILELTKKLKETETELAKYRAMEESSKSLKEARNGTISHDCHSGRGSRTGHC